jgi:hypothetical protein
MDQRSAPAACWAKKQRMTGFIPGSSLPEPGLPRNSHQYGVVIGELGGSEPTKDPVGDGVAEETAEHSEYSC